MRRGLAAFAAAGAWLCGCTAWEPTDELAVQEMGRVVEAAGERDLEALVAGPWRMADGLFDEVGDVEAASATEPEEPEVVSPPVSPPAALASRRPRVPVPRARMPEAATRPSADPAMRARERFVSNPTVVRALHVTVFLPEPYLGQVRLTGGSVEPEAGGGRRAQGAARLVCRELTVEAARITLRPAPSGSDDVRIVARGDVALVSRMGEHVVREEGLKSLIVTNDRFVPLR